MQCENLSESKYCVFTLLVGASIAPYVCAPPAPGPGHTHTDTHCNKVSYLLSSLLTSSQQQEQNLLLMCCDYHSASHISICYMILSSSGLLCEWMLNPRHGTLCVAAWHPVPWSDPGTPSHQQLLGLRLGTHCKGHGKESCQKAADFV